MAKKKKDPAHSASLDPTQPYREAMRELIGRRWAAVWAAVPVALAGEDIEGVHDVRVASRRLRAAMDVSTACFPARWYAPLHGAAKEITGALGEVRDRDVTIEYLTHDRDQAPEAERPGIDLLIARIEQERVTARAAMETYLTSLLASGIVSETRRRFGQPDQPATPAPASNGKGTNEDLEQIR